MPVFPYNESQIRMWNPPRQFVLEVGTQNKDGDVAFLPRKVVIFMQY